MGGDASGECEGCWVGEEWGGGVGWEVGVEGGEAGVEWGGEGIGGEVGDGEVWDGGVVEEVLGNKKPRPVNGARFLWVTMGAVRVSWG